jgi:diguanylate cyclase (GGDEF)-like protein
VYTAYELYVDGEYVGGRGTIATNSTDSRADFSDLVVMFDIPEESSADVVLLVSNYYHPVGGIGVAPIFGRSDQIQQVYARSISLSVGLFTVFLVSVFIILFFHGRLNKDRSLVYFAMFCFALALKVAASNSLLGLFFPGIPVWLVSKFEYLTIPLAALAFSYYWDIVFEANAHRWVLYVFRTPLALYILLILVSPIPYFYPFLMPSIFLIIAMGIVWTVQVAREYVHRRSLPGLMVFGVAVMLLTIVMQAYYYKHCIPNLFLNNMAAIGMVFFVLVNFHTLSYRFLLAKDDVRKASAELESKVSERTRQLHAANEHLTWVASHDELTKVMNRNELMRLIASRRFPAPVSVVYLDMDNFKQVNDLYSHKAGDLVLQAFADKLLKSARASDLVFRVGGDEFVVLLPNTRRDGVLSFAQRLVHEMDTFCTEIAQPLQVELGVALPLASECRLTGSMGIVVQETGEVDVDSMIQQADEALLVAKANGKNRYELVILE